MLNSYRWSSYPAYVGTVKKPEWLSIDFIHELFGIEPLQSFRATYRRQLEEMAALGKWEDSWKQSVKASVLHGPEKFFMAMLQESMVIAGNREESGKKNDWASSGRKLSGQ